MSKKKKEGEFSIGPCKHIYASIAKLQKEGIKILMSGQDKGALVCKACKKYIFLTEDDNQKEDKDRIGDYLFDGMYSKRSLGN